MNLFIYKNGIRQGPYSTEQLKGLVGRGEASISDKVWYEGCKGWAPISDIPELLNIIIPPLPDEQPVATGSQENAPIVDVASEGNSDKWHYLVGDQTCGPKTAEEIRGLLDSGSIPNTTYVFRQGLKDWQRADSLPELRTAKATAGSPPLIFPPAFIPGHLTRETTIVLH